MSANLDQLLSESEMKEVEDTVKSRDEKFNLTRYSEIKDLTVKQLSGISLILMRTEYPVSVPACILPSECINILFRRAQKKDLAIY